MNLSHTRMDTSQLVPLKGTVTAAKKDKEHNYLGPQTTVKKAIPAESLHLNETTRQTHHHGRPLEHLEYQQELLHHHKGKKNAAGFIGHQHHKNYGS